ncbi:MAG TPA: DMT family transporter [Chlamydiales bacterium]|nr:DMT family transporter [Chlamydiales bacterium]
MGISLKTKREHIPPKLLRGVFVCLIAYAFFVTASTLVWNFGTRFSTVQIVFIQNAVSLLCVCPLALRHGIRKLKTKFLAEHLMRDLFGIASYYLYFLAIRSLNLLDATTLGYTAPFFVPLIWWIWMKEKVGGNVWWSIIIGFIGVALILNPDKEILQLGFLYGLFAGITSAVAFSALRILNMHREPMSRILFYYFAFGTMITFPFALVSWEMPTQIEWIQTGGIGVATAIAQILLTLAYQYGTASYLSPLGYVTVIYAGLASWALYDIPPTWRSFIGTILIIIGGTVTYVLKKHPQTIQETFQVPNPKERPPYF